MKLTCTTCDTEYSFSRRDRNEDGSAEIPAEKCAEPTCEVLLCEGACLDHFSFECDCGRRLCNAHLVVVDGLKLCGSCALELRVAQQREPQVEAACTCCASTALQAAQVEEGCWTWRCLDCGNLNDEDEIMAAIEAEKRRLRENADWGEIPKLQPVRLKVQQMPNIPDFGGTAA